MMRRMIWILLVICGSSNGFFEKSKGEYEYRLGMQAYESKKYPEAIIFWLKIS